MRVIASFVGGTPVENKRCGKYRPGLLPSGRFARRPSRILLRTICRSRQAASDRSPPRGVQVCCHLVGVQLADSLGDPFGKIRTANSPIRENEGCRRVGALARHSLQSGLREDNRELAGFSRGFQPSTTRVRISADCVAEREEFEPPVQV